MDFWFWQVRSGVLTCRLNIYIITLLVCSLDIINNEGTQMEPDELYGLLSSELNRVQRLLDRLPKEEAELRALVFASPPAPQSQLARCSDPAVSRIDEATDMPIFMSREELAEADIAFVIGYRERMAEAFQDLETANKGAWTYNEAVFAPRVKALCGVRSIKILYLVRQRYTRLLSLCQRLGLL